MKGILGRKLGMTQVFDKSGKLVPVTVVEVEPNVVTQIKTNDKEGYDAIQLASVTIKEKHATKSNIGHTKKANTTPKRFLKEIRGVDTNSYTLGQELTASLFEAGEVVDVTGISKGKGYQGVIKKNLKITKFVKDASHKFNEETKKWEWVEVINEYPYIIALSKEQEQTIRERVNKEFISLQNSSFKECIDRNNKIKDDTK